MELIFATNNKHKVDEIRHVLKNSILIKSLTEAGIEIEIPEPHNTLEANAREKSSVIYNLKNINCFSEDSGLEVTALNGEPGVKSARYAGTGTAVDNINLLLKNLENKTDRSATFRTVISLMLDGEEYQFEGQCHGKIIEKPRGEKGFGYDPVFIPDGSDQTFAEMSLPEKNLFSHREKATKLFSQFLNHYHGKS